MISDWLPHHIVVDGSVETFKAAVSILSLILSFSRFNWHTLQLVEYDHYLVEVEEDGVGQPIRYHTRIETAALNDSTETSILCDVAAGSDIIRGNFIFVFLLSLTRKDHERRELYVLWLSQWWLKSVLFSNSYILCVWLIKRLSLVLHPVHKLYSIYLWFMTVRVCILVIVSFRTFKLGKLSRCLRKTTCA
jgi:hypothetical protein